MKCKLIFAASLLSTSLFTTGIAHADGPGSYGGYDWSGPYFGLKAGGAFNGDASQSSPFITSGDYDVDGFTIGIMSGYNFQHGNWVFGLDSDASYADIDGGTSTAGCFGSCQSVIEYLGTNRVRVGYAMDRFLPYVTGGLATGLIDGSAGGVNSSSEFHFGWTAGGGVEWAVSDGWSARAEYLFVDLESKFHNPGVQFDIDELHVVRAGISMKTGWIWDSILGR